MDVATVKLELDEIQGNILAGFKNDYITYLFLELSRDVREARAWLADVIADVSTTPEVQTFNAYYSLARSSGFRDSDLPRSSWMNVALDAQRPPKRSASMTWSSTAAEGVPGRHAQARWSDRRYRQGQRPEMGRNRSIQVLASATIDALMIVADDDPANRNTRVADSSLARAGAEPRVCSTRTP